MTKEEKDRFRLIRRVYKKRRGKRRGKLLLLALVFEDRLTGREVSFSAH